MDKIFRITQSMRKATTRKVNFRLIVFLVALLTLGVVVSAQQQGQAYLQFEGVEDYVAAPDHDDFSVSTTGRLTVSAWMKPSALRFPITEGSAQCEKFVHWLGKGEGTGANGQQEWLFRMYSRDCCEPSPGNPRQNRISFYVFNLRAPAGQSNLGVGSYFQDEVIVGEWIHVVGIADGERTHIYKNGVLRDSDLYSGIITPENGTAPLRMGTRDLRSYFQGGLGQVRIWNRALEPGEVAALYATNTVPPEGLVAEYLLNEEAGTLARDNTGLHEDGRIIGGFRPVR